MKNFKNAYFVTEVVSFHQSVHLTLATIEAKFNIRSKLCYLLHEFFQPN